MSETRQPVVRANDWRTLKPPALEDWEPRRTVSVVVPTHRPRHLEYVLAALSAQSYPEHLTEVIVVDDGSTPAVSLPPVRPANTRVVRTTDGWGPAAARHAGALHSDGEVLHWLDDDMVLARDALLADLRWHHLIDHAVVLGHKRFGDRTALDHLTPQRLRAAVVDGRDPAGLARGRTIPHEWIERIHKRTDRLANAGPRAMRVHVTASASVSRDLYLDSGGFPTDLVAGEDTVLGYRLREAGAVFIPEVATTALHLGLPTVVRSRDAMNRFNAPFIADLVPEFRGHRLAVSRSYVVPYLEVCVDVTNSTYEDVRALVDHQLIATVPDLVVTLAGPWATLDEGRRAHLDDPSQDHHLVRAAYRSEPRVRMVDQPPDPSPATFRLALTGCGNIPVGSALEELLREMENQHLGLIEITTAEGIARLERTAAARRARRLAPTAPETLDGLIYPRVTISAADAGILAAADAPEIPQVRGLVPWGLSKQADTHGRC